VIEEAIRSCKAVAEHHRVRISWEPPALELPSVFMEPRRLVQVFQNLIQNAIQHAPPGSAVSVRLEPGPEPEQLQCTVHDQGAGFRPEDLPRAFEPFFSRRPRGVGLGLSIVQRIIDEHHGRVVLSNHPQGGALAMVFLPCPLQPERGATPGATTWPRH
jgi:signal transduction histidine kinase